MINKITDATFDSEIKTGLSIVDFYADWCGPCKALAPVLEKLSNSEEFKDVKFFKLNVDEQQQVASELGIRSIPTLIAFKDGKKIDVKIGGMPEANLKTWIKSL